MNLEHLRSEFQKLIGIVEYDLTNQEFIEIIEEIKKLPVEQRTIPKIQAIVTSKTKIDRFLILEVRDTSDIEYLLDQIEDALKDE